MLKYYDLIRARLEEFAESLAKDEKEVRVGARPDQEFWDNGGHARLRLDWELSDDALTELDGLKDVVKMMLDCAANDIADLLENGDVSESHWLMSAVDGSKKRGKELLDIYIPEVVQYKEHKDKKKSTEYAVYMLVKPKWSE